MPAAEPATKEAVVAPVPVAKAPADPVVAKPAPKEPAAAMDPAPATKPAPADAAAPKAVDPAALEAVMLHIPTDLFYLSYRCVLDLCIGLGAWIGFVLNESEKTIAFLPFPLNCFSSPSGNASQVQAAFTKNLVFPEVLEEFVPTVDVRLV